MDAGRGGSGSLLTGMNAKVSCVNGVQKGESGVDAGS
jgi:hypothetical protein